MRFTEGVWGIREDIAVSSAVEAVEVSSSLPNSTASSIPVNPKDDPFIRAVCATRHIQHRGDMVSKPLINVVVRAPAPSIISVEASHWAGRPPFKEPRVQLFPTGRPKHDGAKVVIDKDQATLTAPGGGARAELDLRSSSFSINLIDEKGECATRLGYQSIQWIFHKAASPSLAEKENATTTNQDLYYRLPAARRQSYMAMAMALDPNEKVYGFGERFGPFIKNGQVIESSNDDGGSSSSSAYKCIPFYVTSKGYGVYVDHQDCVSYEVQSDRMTKVQASVPGESLRIYFIFGDSLKKVLTNYTLLTGRPPLPPDWSYGLWLSTSFLTGYDEKSVMGYVDKMAHYNIPLHVFHFDCFWMRANSWCDFQFDPQYFPDPKGFLRRLHDKGIKVCVWINHWVSQYSRLFPEGDEKGYFVKRTDGRTFQSDQWQPGVAYVDYTNPEAVKWWQSYLAELLDLGVDTFKTDFGERIVTEDIVYHDGSDPRAMHNFYCYQYNKAVWDVLVQKRGKKEACVFARAATPGGQQMPVHWGGDVDSEWTGLAETIRGCLSFGLSGFGYHSSDIGGFKGEGKHGGNSTVPPPAAVYKRWCQFGLLSSHSRLHGSATPRVPWTIDDEACTVLSKFTILKNRLEPYYTHVSIAGAVTLGHPVLRAMLLEFPDDPTVWNLDLQFMIGESLLAVPVLADTKVQYYLPAGKWTNILTGVELSGPGWQVEEHSMLSLPLMLRDDSVLVIGKEGHRVTDSIAKSGCTVVLTRHITKTVSSTVELRNGKQVRVTVDPKLDGGHTVGFKVTTTGVDNFEALVLGDGKGLDDGGLKVVKGKGGSVDVSW